jgi:hypothetical protein
LEEIGSVLINAIRRHSCGGAEGYNDELHSGQPIAWPVVEPRTSQAKLCKFTTKRSEKDSNKNKVEGQEQKHLNNLNLVRNTKRVITEYVKEFKT